jgi:hypothetical protein
MIKPLAYSLVLLIPCAVAAAEDKPEAIAKAKAEEVAQATLKGDFEKILDLTHPDIIRMGGGRDNTLQAMRRVAEIMKTRGFEFHSAKIGDATQVASGSDDKRFAVLPLSLEIKTPDGMLSTSSFLLGISSDKGKTWTFINGDKAVDPTIKRLLPDLPRGLKLPEPKQPVFKPNK